MRFKTIIAGSALCLISSGALAVPFDFIRIGDQDGFGIDPTGHVNASGGPADTDGDGLIEQTEFLPDWNGNGSVATGSGDDFDLRSSDESGGTGPLGGNGYTDNGSSGFEWTDISLSTSMSDDGFPDGDSSRPNEPTFVFDFDVSKGDVVAGTPLFFNLIFGDYDVTPASVELTFDGASDRTIGLTTQGGGEDGLVQAATTNLDFSEIFNDGGAVWNGFLQVDFDALNEPYTAFDFAEVSVTEISFDPTIPEPGVLAMFGVGLAGIGFAARRRRRV